MYTLHIPRFHDEGTDNSFSVTCTLQSRFNTPKLLYSSDWLETRGEESFLCMFDAILDQQSAGPWAEYTVSEMQVFQTKRAYSQLAPSLYPHHFGPRIFAAGRPPLGEARVLSKFLEGNLLHQTPTAFLFTAIGKESPDAPLLLVKHNFHDPSVFSKPSVVTLTKTAKGSNEWLWFQDVSVCPVTGSLVIATPYDQVTGTHEIRIIDYLAPASSRE
jgi:hypothetical protein